MNRKDWRQSFVVLFNGALVGIGGITESINQIAPFIPAKYEPVHAKAVATLALIAGLVNIWARIFKTSTPILAPDPMAQFKP